MTDPPPSPRSPPPEGASPARSRWLPVAVTAIAAIVAIVGERTPLPGLDSLDLWESSEKSVFGLGVRPFVAAMIAVEVLAALVPAWSHLRHGGPEGRRTLSRWATVLGVGLALLLAYRGGEETAARTYTLRDSSLLFAAVLLAGALGAAWLAQRVSRRGLASGFAVFLFAPPLLWQAWASLQDILSGNDSLYAPMRRLHAILNLAGAAVVAAVTWYALERGQLRADRAEGAATYREAPAGGAARSPRVPVPASGIWPLPLAQVLVSLGYRFLPASWPLLALEAVRDALWFALVVPLAFLLAWLWNLPARVGALAPRASKAGPRAAPPIAEATAELRRAIKRTLIFLLGLCAIVTIHRQVSYPVLDVLTVAGGTALVLDAIAEARARRAHPDLVAVWPEHRPYAIAAAREALAAAGIPVCARGERLRRLLQLAGPFVPIELMVPQVHAEAAAKILARLLAAKPPTRRRKYEESIW
jgi:SecY